MFSIVDWYLVEPILIVISPILEQLVYDSCIKVKQIKILKFGSSGKLGVDYWSSKFPMKNLLSKEMLENIAPKIYQSQSWEQTERVACLIELDK